MQNVTISIIIPIFNKKPNLFRRCLASLKAQTYDDFEIIVVDDGSSNRNQASYREILNEFSSLRSIYYFQQNEGVSSARNRGVLLSKGNYIAFVDADDTVERSFLEESAIFACSDYDIIIGSMRYFDVELNLYNDECVVDEPIFLIGKNEIQQLQLALFDQRATFKYNSGRLFGTPCARLYKSTICKDVQFHNNVAILEDQLYNRVFFRNISTACLLPNIWYNYYQYNESAIHYSKNPNSFYIKMLPFWHACYELNLTESNEFRSEAYDYTISLFNSAVENMAIQNQLSKCCENVSRILKVDLFSNIDSEIKVWELKSFKHMLTYMFMKYRMLRLIVLSKRISL